MQIHLPAVLCHFPSQSARAGLAQDALAPAGRHRREDGENSSISLISPVSISISRLGHPPSPMKDGRLPAARSFPPHPCGIQLLFWVYFYTGCLLEQRPNTSPSSSTQSGRFIGKSNQDSRGKSFLNVSAKQRARLNCLGYKKDREPHIFPFSALPGQHRCRTPLRQLPPSEPWRPGTRASFPAPPHLPVTGSQISSITLNLDCRRGRKQRSR